MLRLYAVLLNFSGAPPVDRIKELFAPLKDWLRFSPEGWLVFTGLNAADLRDRIRDKFAAENPDILVIEASDAEWALFAGKTAREWMRRDHAAMSGE